MRELQKFKMRLALGRFWRKIDGPLSVFLALVSAILLGMVLTAYYIRGLERTFDDRLAHVRANAIKETDATWSARYSELSGRLDESTGLVKQSLALSQTLSQQLADIAKNQKHNLGVIQRHQSELAHAAATQAVGETVTRLTVDSRATVNQAVRGRK